MSWIARLGADIGALRGQTGRELQLRLDTARLFLLTNSSYVRGLQEDVGSLTLDDMPPFQEQVSYVVNRVSDLALNSVCRAELISRRRHSAKGLGTTIAGEARAPPPVRDRTTAFSTRRRPVHLENLVRDQSFSTRVAQSSIPGAGFGLFVDGEAPAGALITLYPGISYRPSEVKHLPDYPAVARNNEHLLWRYDGVIVDGSPNAITKMLQHYMQNSGLDEAVLHAYAAGQFVNHPPPGGNPNALQYALDISLLQLPTTSPRFVPTVPWQPELSEGILADGTAQTERDKRKSGVVRRVLEGLENAAIRQRVASSGLLSIRNSDSRNVRKSIAMIATRPIVNEEVYINYRFNPHAPDLPEWYTECNPEESRRRWAQEGFWS
jgi:hypothetical protein